MRRNRFMTKCGFSQKHPLRPLTLLRCSIAILTLVIKLVPLHALAGGVGAAPDEGGAAELNLLEEEPEGTDWRERTRTGDPTETLSADIELSSVQDERSLLLEPLALAASPKRIKRMCTTQQCILLATLIGVMLALLGAAAHHSGAFTGLKQKLVTLIPEAEDQVGLLVPDVSPVSPKPLEEGTASARQKETETGVSAAAKEAREQQQQEEFNVSAIDPTTSLRSLSTVARDKAQVMNNEAKAVVQRMAARNLLEETQLQALNEELIQSYLTTTKALESSISAHAADAEEAMKALENLPPLQDDDDGHTVGQAVEYMKFIELRAALCTFAEDLLRKYDTHPLEAHRQYYVNDKLTTQILIEKLHALMNSYKAIAVHALNQEASAVPSDVSSPLEEFVKAVDELNKQFLKVELASQLTRSQSTENIVQASVSLTTETAQFMNLHDVCFDKLKQVHPFLDSGKVPRVEGSKVLRDAMKAAFLQCEKDRNYVTTIFKLTLQRRQSLVDGVVGGFKRPVVNEALIQTAANAIEAVDKAFNDAVDEIESALDESADASFEDDLAAMQRVFKIRTNLVRLSKKADEYNAFFKMLTALVFDIESSVVVYESVEQSHKRENKAEPLFHDIDALLHQFRVNFDAAKEAANLPDIAQAANALRTLSDQLLISVYRLKQG
ncbi:hypothetical protein Emed_003789 [Eimeria media]